MKRLTARTEEDTLRLGARLAALLPEGGFVALCGDLGAGKTALVRGMGASLGTDTVASPTFTIVQEHDTTPPLLHFDAYRLADADELYAIGFADYLDQNALIVMEWAELVSEALPKERLDIQLSGSGDEPRTLTLTPHGEKYAAILERL